MARLFAGGKVPADIDQRELMQQLWALAVNEQDTRSGITFRDLFTPEELYAVWEGASTTVSTTSAAPGRSTGDMPCAMRRRCSKRSSPAPTVRWCRAPSADLAWARRQPHAPDLPDGFRRLHGRGFRSGSDRGRMARLPYFTDGGQHPDDLLPERGTADILVRILHNEHEMYFSARFRKAAVLQMG